jgi:hypothetical protein
LPPVTVAGPLHGGPSSIVVRHHAGSRTVGQPPPVAIPGRSGNTPSSADDRKSDNTIDDRKSTVVLSGYSSRNPSHVTDGGWGSRLGKYTLGWNLGLSDTSPPVGLAASAPLIVARTQPAARGRSPPQLACACGGPVTGRGRLPQPFAMLSALVYARIPRTSNLPGCFSVTPLLADDQKASK